MKRENQISMLRQNLIFAVGALLVAFLVLTASTFAWYIYNTSTHTTNVHMAAGTGATLLISNSYDGHYSSSAVLDEFVGELRPVSTDRISNGFQKVTGIGLRESDTPWVVAAMFGECEESDYYKSSLFIRTTGVTKDVYLSDIGYNDDDAVYPISSAIRVGIVVHEAGENQPMASEYIFSINDAKNPEAKYNTMTGEEGYVLDSTKTDGTTIPFKPMNADQFCIYDTNTGLVTLKPDSLKICTVTPNADGTAGESVQVDVYIWLEGCDEDCTVSLLSKTLKNVSVSFAGVNVK